MAINVAALSVVIAIVSLTIITISLYALEPWIFSAQSLKTLVPYFWLIPVSLLFTSMYELVSIWSTRRKAFGVIARSMVLQMINGNLVKIGLGLAALKPIGLLIGQIVAQGGGIIVLLRDALPELRPLLRKISRRRMKHAMVAYWRFPVFLFPSQLLAVGAEQAPILFIAAQYDAILTGSFALAMTAVALPVMMIAKSLSRAYYGNIAELGRNQADNIYKLTMAMGKRLLFLALFIGILLFFAAEPLFPLIFGSDWVVAGQIMSALAPYLVGTLIFTSINQVLNVFHRQDIKLWLDAQRAGIVLLLFGWAYVAKPEFLTLVWAYSGLMLMHFALSTIWVLVFLRRMRPQLQT